MPAGEAGPGDLAARLARRIRDDGPIPVSEFVDAALYDPADGFYMVGGRAGRAGDFLTAPEVGGLFGAVVARAVDVWWDELGSPDPFWVVDMGAGPGTLARSVLAAEPRAMVDGALWWAAVEVSAAQRALHPEGDTVISLERPPTELEAPAVIVANELLDNLPFDVVERTDDGWSPVRVDVDAAGRFTTVVGGPAEPGPGRVEAPVGARIPIQTAARRFVAEMCALVPRGRLVVIDYGADTSTLAGRPEMGWLRTHRRHDRPGGWLDEPGSRDITVDVAIDQITADHPATAITTQAAFLRRHGIDELVAEGRQIWAERAHIGDLPALKARSRVSEAEALLDPAGMGDFFVAEWGLG